MIKDMVKIANKILEGIRMAEGVKSTATLKELVKGSKKFDGGARKDSAGTVRFSDLQYNPMIGVKRLRVLATSSTGHSQVIDFHSVNYMKEKDKDHTIEIVEPKTKTKYYIDTLKFDKTKVDVRCSCPDFTYRFAYHVKGELNALAYGRLKPYVKKTDRKPINPDQIPGLCKHLLLLVDTLSKNGYLDKSI